MECSKCHVPSGAWIVCWSDKDGPGYTVYAHAERADDGTWDAWDEDAYAAETLDRAPRRVVLTGGLCQQCQPRRRRKARGQADFTADLA